MGWKLARENFLRQDLEGRQVQTDNERLEKSIKENRKQITKLMQEMRKLKEEMKKRQD